MLLLAALLAAAPLRLDDANLRAACPSLEGALSQLVQQTTPLDDKRDLPALDAKARACGFPSAKALFALALRKLVAQCEATEQGWIRKWTPEKRREQEANARAQSEPAERSARERNIALFDKHAADADALFERIRREPVAWLDLRVCVDAPPAPLAAFAREQPPLDDAERAAVTRWSEAAK